MGAPSDELGKFKEALAIATLGSMQLSVAESIPVQIADEYLQGDSIDLSYGVKVPNDDRRINFEVPEILTVVGYGELQMREAMHCVLCHGSGHRHKVCQWRQLIEKVSFDLVDPAAAMP
jgi:hypothetical protein